MLTKYCSGSLSSINLRTKMLGTILPTVGERFCQQKLTHIEKNNGRAVSGDCLLLVLFGFAFSFVCLFLTVICFTMGNRLTSIGLFCGLTCHMFISWVNPSMAWSFFCDVPNHSSSVY